MPPDPELPAGARPDRDSALPRGVSLQERIFRVLEERIETGAFPAGSALPGEEALAGQFGVSRVTIRAVLARLAGDGRIERVQGRGTMILPPRAGRATRLSLSDVLASMDDLALATSVRFLAFETRPVPARVAAFLGLETGAPCQYSVRLRSAEGKVVLQMVSYIPEAIGQFWTQADLAGTTTHVLLREHGFAPASGQQIVSAVLAGPEEAERLDVKIGEALLRVQRTYSNADGMPVQYVDVLGPASFFDLRMSLRLEDAE